MRPRFVQVFLLRHPDGFLARHTIAGPWQGLQPLRRNGLLAREANTKIPRLHAIQSFFHQAQLPVIQTVQSKRDEFVMRELRLILLSYAAHFGDRVELDSQPGDDLVPFLDQPLAICLG